jgi:hypothetical protein
MKSLKLHAALVSAVALLLALVVASTAAAGSMSARRPSHAGKQTHAHRARHRKRRPHRAHAMSATAPSTPAGAQALIGGNSKTDCVYAANSIQVLQAFDQMVNRNFECVLVYNDASPDWVGWEDPWFLTEQDPNYNWVKWATAPRTHRQLIITNSLFPSQLINTDWLHAGASGAYDGHARALARNLVAAGLGNAVIRLGAEANDSSSQWSIGSTDESFQLWRQFWRRTVLAMRSVPGAHFLFDWCINAYWRPIPLSKWYPGNDVVDIVGIDAYDAGVPAGENRWSRIYNQTDGIRDVLRFAAAHGKPLSIPEWGLWTSGPGTLGGGGDPAYIDGIGGVVRNNRVAYQAYFYNHDAATLLANSPWSLESYRRHFGGGSDSVRDPAP